MGGCLWTWWSLLTCQIGKWFKLQRDIITWPYSCSVGSPISYDYIRAGRPGIHIFTLMWFWDNLACNLGKDSKEKNENSKVSLALWILLYFYVNDDSAAFIDSLERGSWPWARKKWHHSKASFVGHRSSSSLNLRMKILLPIPILMQVLNWRVLLATPTKDKLLCIPYVPYVRWLSLKNTQPPDEQDASATVKEKKSSK